MRRALAPYRVSVRDDGGHDVVAGEEGSLWVSGPTLPLGYLDGPSRTRPAPTASGGWLCTGDRAVVDDLRGRNDDMELVGGICVAPGEVEAVLGRHPAVTEAAVAGVVVGGASHLGAFVVPAPAAGPPATVAAQLLALARAELAPFKVPRSVTFVDALRRTPTGKLRRFVLRTGAWASDPPGSPDPPPGTGRSGRRRARS